MKIDGVSKIEIVITQRGKVYRKKIEVQNRFIYRANRDLYDSAENFMRNMIYEAHKRELERVVKNERT